MGPTESQNRFNRVFQEFIGVFTRAEHPLVIFLDDLEWADSASLNLMQLLVGNSESQYLLLIGAYRDNEVHPKMVSSMQLGTDRIRDIMQSLCNFSRIDGTDKKPADIHAGIDSTLMILQHRLKAKPERPTIQVIKEYGDLPAVKCYSGQLNQVFMNLFGNAIDALDESNCDRTYAEIEQHPNIITVCTEVKESSAADFVADVADVMGNKQEMKGEGRSGETESFAVIRIQDNGRGMTEATRCKLFDSFFTTKPEGKGTGLGLSISYQIVVEKHGGAIECISEPGKGAEFVITIPLN